MRKVFLEIGTSLVFVLLGTFVAYTYLSGTNGFWDAQTVWSTVLVVGWMIVSLGYYRQGWIVHMSKSATHVSLALPIAVFFVQCILFVKGIFYHDWSLVAGALIVNSGVSFSLYHIIKARAR